MGIAGRGHTGQCLAAAAQVLLAAALLVAFASFASQVGVAAEASSGVRLIMVEEKGCRYCIAWDREIGKIYQRTSEGHFAPLKRVRRGAPEIRSFDPVVYTPTFIVVRSGEEVGRITGYPGKDYFFPELKVLLSGIGYLPI